MNELRKLLRYAGLASALMLVLAACTPAAIGSLFAPCPQPTPEEWAASQEEWLAAAWTDSQPAQEEPSDIR